MYNILQIFLKEFNRYCQSKHKHLNINIDIGVGGGRGDGGSGGVSCPGWV